MYGWTEAQDQELVSLTKSGKYFYSDIAELLGRRPASIRWRARKLGLPSYPADDKRVGQWNTKHAHLRGQAMRYYVDHTREETEKRFGLTRSEFKSLMTVSYRMAEFKHLRKDTRTKELWTSKDYKFLLRHAGLKPRSWIAKKLKRGGVQGIKDRLEKLQVASRTLNGMTLSQYRQAFEKEPVWLVETDAGPGGGISKASHFKIVPWVQIQEDIKKRRVSSSELLEQIVDSMALFQRWVHGKNAKRNIKRICTT